MLTLHRADEYVQQSLRACANGYVLKEATPEELSGAVPGVLNGKDLAGRKI